MLHFSGNAKPSDVYHELLTNFGSDNHHILYSALAHISVNLLGESPAALRLAAMLSGVLSIWAGAHLVRYVFGKKGSADHRRISAAAWAHLTAITIAIAHGLVLLTLGLNYPRASRAKSWQWQPFLALGLAGWLTINIHAPVMPQLYRFFNQPDTGSTTGSAEWNKRIWPVNEILHNFGVGLALGWFSVAIVGAMGMFGLLCVFRRDWLFPLLAVAPVLVAGITYYSLERILWPRMFFPEIGFLAAIAAVGVLEAGQSLTRIIRPWPGLMQIALALLLCILLSVSLPKV